MPFDLNSTFTQLPIDAMERYVANIQISDMAGVRMRLGSMQMCGLLDAQVVRLAAEIRGTREAFRTEDVKVPLTWRDHLLHDVLHCRLKLPARLSVWLLKRIKYRTIAAHTTINRLCPHLPEFKNLPDGRMHHIAWLAEREARSYDPAAPYGTPSNPSFSQRLGLKP